MNSIEDNTIFLHTKKRLKNLYYVYTYLYEKNRFQTLDHFTRKNYSEKVIFLSHTYGIFNRLKFAQWGYGKY